MAKITEKITSLIGPVLEDMGYELVGIEYIASGKHSTLRIFIDTDHGIGIEDCEKASHQLSAIFDVEDPITGQYNLEVSSPGIERPLFHIGHYQRFLGNDISLRMVRPINKQRKFKGSIGSVSELDNTIELITELGSVTLDIDMIEKANLIADF
ncbi:ribosome maturation factor RimP [Candidatus Thioglobus sp.]|jgi:ribosome maturation factor RimP|uniref:FIG000325: clustered with transcription termination protein NusA n=1 Tax=hydrothermal vent metagenome TaxID=652676 RepID=A0A1W1D701_9ZZZZ|nr:ribosome maturation factor RimP [Candidatus Thioglobus sp.]HIL03611.1 ribosome maturation factor RimP [Candidatus Thioglobus autotrophicus]HIB28847.1 ribosome maturation factor RimP [Candidatus Thioglobus sp.]HIB30374.1 ribosome maturation factor RimP [Candidatus Thioglobus sp.]HIB97706.1 ribosome maturation factor RimP [Candidatus Thioglobus sp.]HIF47786.1 ribosome maturation factor RimP [Candidatus Thioglobus sp.]